MPACPRDGAGHWCSVSRPTAVLLPAPLTCPSWRLPLVHLVNGKASLLSKLCRLMHTVLHHMCPCCAGTLGPALPAEQQYEHCSHVTLCGSGCHTTLEFWVDMSICQLLGMSHGWPCRSCVLAASAAGGSSCCAASCDCHWLPSIITGRPPTAVPTKGLE